LAPVRTTVKLRAGVRGRRGRGPLGSEAEVSVSWHDAWSRLICAGWLPAGRCVRLERCAGLRSGVA